MSSWFSSAPMMTAPHVQATTCMHAGRSFLYALQFIQERLPGLQEQRSEPLEWLLQMKCVRDKDYVPNFKTAFEHFLVHTGGRAVIEEVEKKLCLDPADVQPSKETLYRYGNTCCAAVFYVLTNMESRVSAHSPYLHTLNAIWIHLLHGMACTAATCLSIRACVIHNFLSQDWSLSSYACQMRRKISSCHIEARRSCCLSI